MFKKLFFREIKEKLGLALLAAVLLTLMVPAFLLLGLDLQVRAILSVAVVIGLPPILALFLGLGAFEEEHKDGAWAFLFSRPVKKETIWLAKYAGLLVLLILVSLLVIIEIRFLPGLGEIMAGFMIFGWSLSLLFLLSFLIFNIAFFLSFLSDRRFLLVFLVLGTLAVLAVLSLKVYVTANMAWIQGNPALFLVLPAFGFAAASLLAFRKADFTQPSKNTRRFLAFGIPFVVLAFLLSAGWTLAPLKIGFLAQKDYGFPQDSSDLDSAYFWSGTKLERFDGSKGELLKVFEGRRNDDLYRNVFVGKDRILFIREVLKFWALRPRILRQELWTQRPGEKKVRLIEDLTRMDTSVSISEFSNPQLSRDGRRISLLSSSGYHSEPGSLWILSEDGKNTERYSLPDKGYFTGHCWAGNDRFLFVLAYPPKWPSDKTNLWRLSLDDGRWTLVSDTLLNAWFIYRLMSPDGSRVAFFEKKTGVSGRETALNVCDAATLQKHEIKRWKGKQDFSWSPDGERLAVLENRDILTVYSAADGSETCRRPVKLDSGEKAHGVLWWTEDGRKIVYGDFHGSKSLLHIFSADLGEEKLVNPPWEAPASPYFTLWGAGSHLLLGGSSRRILWTYNLNTDSWKKIR